MSTRRRVVVTGIGGVTPLANDIVTTWQQLLKGVSGVGAITRFDASAYSSRIAGEVKGFEPLDYFDAKELKKVDIFVQFAVAACSEAFGDAKLKDTDSCYSADRIGCILGVGIGGLAMLERNHIQLLNGGPRKVSPFLIPGMITNMAPGIIGIKFGCKGINYTIQSACTSSTHAIGESYRLISSGWQDVVITGGTEGAITTLGIGGFCALKALSTRNDEPEKASRPFDRDRDGFIMGEGSVVLILEEYENAKKRGAKIYAEIVGYGSSCDAYHMTAPSLDGSGAMQCMQNALTDGGLSANVIQYINAHGTSTPANDATETLAIKSVFRETANSGLLVSSTKSATGHLLGAAGAIEAAFCCLAIQDDIIPPTINLENPDVGCDLDYVAHQPRHLKIDYAMSNSFGFGGTNSSLIFKRVS
jgi:3-oxoacyl-[acyl-carrier-protein] synthase II